MKTLRPLLFLVSMLLVVGLACVIGGETPAPPPTELPVQVVEPTVPPEPTEPPVTEPPVPTEPPATEPPTPEPVASDYFTEEFDQDPGWNYFITYGDEEKATVEFTDSLMAFDLEDLGIFAYYIYEGKTYEDVRIDMRAENRGRNNNNISLVCRYDGENWYEFSTEGGGLWYLYAVTPGADGKPAYNVIANGGAQSLKQGKEVNDFAMVCEGNEIRLIINDKEVRKIEDQEYAFRDGNVGFNISSLNVVPIVVEVDWFKVSAP